MASKKSSDFLDFSKETEIQALADGNTRVVTPDNPLNISETNPTYDDVEIKGGQIFTQAETIVTIKKLTKTS